MRVSREVVTCRAKQLQHRLMQAEKPEEEDGPYRYTFKLLGKNETFIDRIAQLEGDTVEEMRLSAESLRSRENRRHDRIFNIGMGLTVAGFGGLVASCVFPGIPQVTASIVALSAGTGMTHMSLDSRSHEPYQEVAAQLEQWGDYLAFKDQSLPQSPLEVAGATYLSPQEISVSRVQALAEEVQKSLDSGHGLTPMGRLAYGNERDARLRNPLLLKHLDGDQLGEMDQSRKIAFHNFMAEGALDHTEDLLQGLAVLGGLVAWIHPKVSLVEGLIGVGLLGASSYGARRLRLFHRAQKQEAEEVAIAVAGWRTAVAQTDAKQGLEAARVIDLAQRPLDRSLEIAFEEDAIEVGGQLLEVDLG